MRPAIAIILVVIMLAGLAMQLRTFSRAQPAERARMRPGLILQSVVVIVLVALNLYSLR